MPKQQSRGSKLGAIAGLVITFAFFLPWARACNSNVSGLDLALDNTPGVYVESSWMYWLTLLGGIFCLALIFAVQTPPTKNRIKAAYARLAAGIVGFIPVLNIWANVSEDNRIEVLYGGYMTVLGYLGVFVSFFLDIKDSSEEKEKTDQLVNREDPQDPLV